MSKDLTDVVMCSRCERSVLKSESIEVKHSTYICTNCAKEATPTCFMCPAIVVEHNDLCGDCAEIAEAQADTWAKDTLRDKFEVIVDLDKV